MAVMFSIKFSESERRTLLEVAKKSVEFGVEHHRPFPINPDEYSEQLTASLACFVTLEKYSELRGCIGTLEPIGPLISSVAKYAYAAAFEDPRFPQVVASELSDLDYEISVLSKPEKLYIDSEQALLEMVRPGVDGLIVEEGYKRATYLPSVWEQISDAKMFVHELKRKAGLPRDHWSSEMNWYRYEAVKIQAE